MDSLYANNTAPSMSDGMQTSVDTVLDNNRSGALCKCLDLLAHHVDAALVGSIELENALLDQTGAVAEGERAVSAKNGPYP